MSGASLQPVYFLKYSIKLDVTGVTDTTSIILEYGSCFHSEIYMYNTHSIYLQKFGKTLSKLDEGFIPQKNKGFIS